MRQEFARIIHQKMLTNNRIWIVTADFGYKMWDQVKTDYPKRFINVGAAEQTMLGMAIGLALEGKIPIVYAATPFLLYRPFEIIRNYLNQEKIPVKLIGSGRNKDYFVDGFSHWAQEDKAVMKLFKNIVAKWPKSIKELPQLINKMLTNKKPWYINLTRKPRK